MHICHHDNRVIRNKKYLIFSKLRIMIVYMWVILHNKNDDRVLCKYGMCMSVLCVLYVCVVCVLCVLCECVLCVCVCMCLCLCMNSMMMHSEY